MGSKIDEIKDLDTLLSFLQKIWRIGRLFSPFVFPVILTTVCYFRGLPVEITVGLSLGWITCLTYVVLYVVKQNSVSAQAEPNVFAAKPRPVAVLELHRVVREEIDKTSSTTYSVQR